MRHRFASRWCAIALAVVALTGCATTPRRGTGLSPAEVVRIHLDGKAHPELFEDARAPVVGISGGEGAHRIWYRTSGAVVREQRASPIPPHRIDSLRVAYLEDALASVTVIYRTADDRIRCRGVYTLSAESGAWKIVAWVFETRFHRPVRYLSRIDGR